MDENLWVAQILVIPAVQRGSTVLSGRGEEEAPPGTEAAQDSFHFFVVKRQ